MPDGNGDQFAFEALAGLALTRGNGARLLVDGTVTFEALFEAVRQAERYVLAQFYIVHLDFRKSTQLLTTNTRTDRCG